MPSKTFVMLWNKLPDHFKQVLWGGEMQGRWPTADYNQIMTSDQGTSNLFVNWSIFWRYPPKGSRKKKFLQKWSKPRKGEGVKVTTKEKGRFFEDLNTKKTNKVPIITKLEGGGVGDGVNVNLSYDGGGLMCPPPKVFLFFYQKSLPTCKFLILGLLYHDFFFLLKIQDIKSLLYKFIKIFELKKKKNLWKQ